MRDLTGVPEEFGLVSFQDPDDEPEVARINRKTARRMRQQFDREVKRKRINYIPGPIYGSGGAARAHNLRGGLDVLANLRRSTSYTVAAAYPLVASGSLGVPGVCMGTDETGGGGFFFDPWELYNHKVVSGFSMLVLGSIGKGKSTMVKSLVSRLVLAGRRAVIMTDKKGEWLLVARFLGGKVITPGQRRINPLEEGIRPSTDAEGNPLTDQMWERMVRSRRLSLITSCAQILEDRKLHANEHKAIRMAVDQAVRAAPKRKREPIIPDVLEYLDNPPEEINERLRAGFEEMSATLSRMVDGDLEGMFDGTSDETFDPSAPIVVLNTKGLDGFSEDAKKIAYACTQSWAEAAVTSRDYGQRILVYEEGAEALGDPGSLSRMVTQWKLARDYGICNVLVLHKLGDLNMAGDVGSKTHAEALSLLGDSDIRVVYHQNPDQMKATREALDLTDRECEKVQEFGTGFGLWKLGGRSFVVRNVMTNPEKSIFDTDAALKTARDEEADDVGKDEPGQPVEEIDSSEGAEHR